MAKVFIFEKNKLLPTLNSSVKIIKNEEVNSYEMMSS